MTSAPIADTTYDVIVVGSSPLSLLEAAYQASRGADVLVLESGAQLGGAWQDMPALGVRRSEVGPHIIRYNPTAYDYFARELGLSMIEMRPAPSYIIKTRSGARRLPYVLSPFIAYVTLPWHYLTKPDFRERFAEIREEYFGRFGDAARQLARLVFTGKAPRFLYPRGGTVEMMARIVERLQKFGVLVQTESRVHGLERMADGTVQVQTAAAIFTARHRVLITRHQRIDWAGSAEGRADLRYQPLAYTGLHFLVRTREPSPTSFALSKRNPVWNLISDLTPWTDPAEVPSGHRLYVGRMHRWNAAWSREEVAAFVRELCSERVLAADAELADFQFSSYEQGYLPQESLDAMTHYLGDALVIQRSAEFASSIGDCVQRWRTPTPASVAGKSRVTAA